MHRIAAVLNLLTQLNKYSSNNLIRHECQNGICGGCFFILFDAYLKSPKNGLNKPFFGLFFLLFSLENLTARGLKMPF